MTAVSRVRDEFSAWIASVAEAIVAGFNRLMVHQQVQLIETDPNSFAMKATAKPNRLPPAECRFSLIDDQPGLALSADWKAALKGSRLEVRLRSSRFLFRPLDLPRRAIDFLDGMIRSQIDRLTPWTANEAVFSWSEPGETSGDRIHLTVVAAPKAKVTPFVRLAEDWGVGSVILVAVADGQAGAAGVATKIFEKSMLGSLDVVRVRRVLSMVLLVAAITAALSFVIADFVRGRLDTQQQLLSRRISERRAAMRLNSATGDSAQNLLARLKQTTPSSVVVLEALSEILPDNTYATELHIEKDRLQVVGVTQDAPSLVKLMEQSPHFTRATFFAPTTRSTNDPGERFHVEARLKPYFGVGK